MNRDLNEVSAFLKIWTLKGLLALTYLLLPDAELSVLHLTHKLGSISGSSGSCTMAIR